MKQLFLLLAGFFSSQIACSQGFTSWIVGDTADVVVNGLRSGVVLAGGGGDNDEAMQWMLSQADSGDVVVIRASGSDGYNDYFLTELGVAVNSVETIRFDQASAATDPYVLRRLAEAEVVFMAGGDQYDYYQYWKDSPVGDTLNFLINTKGITIGGTSAGMAILGGAYYAPSGASLQSDVALANPFHPAVDILGHQDFLAVPFLENLVTDTHYEQRERPGRHMVFLGRLAALTGGRAFGIACNEYTAVCMDSSGIGRVFGDFPEYDDVAFFLQSNCQEESLPEMMLADSAFTWSRSQAAVIAYRVPGTADGTHSFDLNTWQSGIGGSWEHWYVEEGVLSRDSTESGACDLATSLQPERSASHITIFPNPADKELFLSVKDPLLSVRVVRVWDLAGRMISERTASTTIDVSKFVPGAYFIEIITDKGSVRQPFLIER